MAPIPTKRIWLAAAAAAVAIAAAFLVFHFSRKSSGSPSAELLGFVPEGATSAIYIDVDQLRASPFLGALYSWAPHPALDNDYAQFIADTGFDYERDLSAVFIAVSRDGVQSNTLAIAEGRFHRKKIAAYLSRTSPPVRSGDLEVFQIPARDGRPPASFAFLSDHRVALCDSGNLSLQLSAAVASPARAEWQMRFARLLGSPVFAVIRQDPAVLGLATNRSPELAAFIGQLPWISLAARPDGELLRVVAEGETITDTAASQLRDFLEGIRLLAEAGLDDAKLRRQMDPAERAAYRELLKGTEIDRIARGESKSVRVVVPITTEFLKVAKIPSPGGASLREVDPPPAPGNQKLAARPLKAGKKKQR